PGQMSPGQMSPGQMSPEQMKEPCSNYPAETLLVSRRAVAASLLRPAATSARTAGGSTGAPAPRTRAASSSSGCRPAGLAGTSEDAAAKIVRTTSSPDQG